MIAAASALAFASTPGAAVVVDASVIVEVLLASHVGQRAMARLVGVNADLHAPELLDVEVLHVLRRAVRRDQLSAKRAAESIALLETFPIRRHGHGPLRRRIWQHRANLSAYDATYVALAEGLGGTLLTRDAHLAGVPNIAIEVELV